MTNSARRLGKLVAEIKRRNVFKVTGVYAVAAWGASLGAAELLPAFGAPDWAVRVFVLAAVLGLPLAAVLAWIYEITPRGIERDASVQPLAADWLGQRGNTTMLFGSHGVVQVSWQDGAERREKIFASDFLLGRDASCAVRFDDPMVSRKHAAVTFADGRWWISDLGSRNGTLVDDRLVTREPLPGRCRLRLYEAGPELRVEMRAGSGAPTVTIARRGAR